MGRRRVIQGILDGLRAAYYVTAIAVECILGVTLMIVTVAGSAAAAIRAPNLCINSNKNAVPEQGVAWQEFWSKSMTNFRVRKKMLIGNQRDQTKPLGRAVTPSKGPRTYEGTGVPFHQDNRTSSTRPIRMRCINQSTNIPTFFS